MADLELTLRLTADGSVLVSEVKRADQAVDGLSDGLRKSGQAAQTAERGYRSAARGVRSISEQLTRARRDLIAFVSIGSALRGFSALTRIADQYTLLNARLKLVTESTEQFRQANERLFRIAQDTRTTYGGTVDTFTRLARATRELGVSQDQLLAVTQTINQALAVSGASAESARAALFQLGQGLSAGALRGEELNSVLEQTPRLAEAIADGMGVTIGELRALGAEGALTAERVINALLSQRQAVEREFGAVPQTVGQAMTKLNNALARFIGQANESIDASGRLARAINVLADNIGRVASAILTVGKLAVLWFGGRMLLAFGTAVSSMGLMARAAAGLRTALLGATLAFRAGVGPIALFTGSLRASAAATWANVRAAGALKTALGLLFGAVAGWEIGSWIRENFVQARVAGLAFVGAMLNAWERLKFFGRAMWAAIKATGQDAIDTLKSAMAGFLDFLARAADRLGFEGTAQRLRAAADGFRPVTDATEQFRQKLAELRAEMNRNIAANDDIITDLVAYERTADKAAAATDNLAGAHEDLAGVLAPPREEIEGLTEAQQSLLDSLFPAEAAFRDYGDALNELARIQQTLGWTDGQFQEAVDRLTEAYLGLNEATEQAATQMRKVRDNQPVAEIFADTARSIRRSFRDTFRDVFDNGIEGFKGLADRIKNLFKDMLADLATLAIARPVIVPVVSALGSLLGIPQAAQGQVLAQIGGSLVAGPGQPGLPGVPGLGLLGSKAIGLLGGLSPALQLGIPGAIGGYLVGRLLGFKGTGATIGSTLGGVAGSIGSVLLASGSSAIGAAIGAKLGSAVPIVGTIIGAALGGLIGKLFGKKPKPYKLQFQTVATPKDLPRGRRADGSVETPFGVVAFSAWADYLRDAGSKFLKFVKGVDEAVSTVLNPDQIAFVRRTLTAGEGYKSRAFQFRKLENQLFTVARDRLGFVIDAVAGQAGAQFGIARKLLDQVPTGRKNIDKLVQTAQQVIGQINAYREAMDALGRPVTQARQAIDQINERFDQLRQTAEQLGFNVGEVERARQQELDRLTRDFNQGVRRAILQFTDPLQAALEAQAETASQRLREARELGADLVEVERLNMLERRNVIEQFGGDLVNTLSDVFDQVDELLGRPTVSRRPVSDVQRQLDFIEQEFERAASEIRKNVVVSNAIRGFKAGIARIMGISVERVRREAQPRLDELEALRQQAIAAVRKRFGDDIDRAIRAITDPLSVALDDLEAKQRQRLEDARLIGADLVEVERLNMLERRKVIEQFASQTGGALSGALDNLRGFVDSMGLQAPSPLLPAQRLAEAQRLFNQGLEAARGGDADAVNSLPGLAQQLLREGRDFFAGTEGFQDLFRQVNRQLGDLLVQAEFADPVVNQLRANGEQSVENTAQIIDALAELRAEVAALRAENRALSDELARLSSAQEVA